MPWVWGELAGRPAPYHLVWSRDLYQVATALLAAGDRAAAERARRLPVRRASRSPTAASRRTRNVDGTPQWPNLQLDEVAVPIVLAWQLGRSDAGTYAHVKAAADFIVATARDPAGALGEPGRLLAGDDRRGDRRPRLRRRHRARATATTARRRALRSASPTTGSASVDGWTLTTNGPLSRRPVLPAPDQGRQPRRGHDVHDRRRRPDDRPARGRRPELPRARAARRQARRRRRRSLDRCRSSTASSASTRPTAASGTATTSTATARRSTAARSRATATLGRLWPIFAGERGEYELPPGSGTRRAGGCARSRTTANDGTAAARAGVGRPAAAGHDGRHAGTVLGHAARLDPRAARAARVVDRRRPSGRAAGGRRLPLRVRRRLQREQLASRARRAPSARRARPPRRPRRRRARGCGRPRARSRSGVRSAAPSGPRRARGCARTARARRARRAPRSARRG